MNFEQIILADDVYTLQKTICLDTLSHEKLFGMLVLAKYTNKLKCLKWLFEISLTN